MFYRIIIISDLDYLIYKIIISRPTHFVATLMLVPSRLTATPMFIPHPVATLMLIPSCLTVTRTFITFPYLCAQVTANMQCSGVQEADTAGHGPSTDRT